MIRQRRTASASTSAARSPTAPSSARTGRSATGKVADDARPIAHAASSRRSRRRRRGSGCRSTSCSAQAERVVHGTTTGTNALITRAGAKRRPGHHRRPRRRDRRHEGRGPARRPGRRPPARHAAHRQARAARRRARWSSEVTERIDFEGEVIVAARRGVGARRRSRGSLDGGVDALTVSLLWSPRNAAHEQRVVAARPRAPPGAVRHRGVGDLRARRRVRADDDRRHQLVHRPAHGRLRRGDRGRRRASAATPAASCTRSARAARSPPRRPSARRSARCTRAPSAARWAARSWRSGWASRTSSSPTWAARRSTSASSAAARPTCASSSVLERFEIALPMVVRRLDRRRRRQHRVARRLGRAAGRPAARRAPTRGPRATAAAAPSRP